MKGKHISVVSLIVLLLYIVLQNYLSSPSHTPAVTSTPVPTKSVLPAATGVTDWALVVKVVDGDTLTVSLNGKKEKVRLIGIDTPESVDPRRPVECFAKEASRKMSDLVSNQTVRLVSDPSQGDKDKYQRLLRYVFNSKGELINQLMIEGGYAHEYTYDSPYQYQKAFKDAENRARTNEVGLWAKGVCS
jgi:micrococcal nuclease